MADRKYYVICDIGCKFESMTKEQILTAIMQAVENGEIKDVDTGFVTTIKTVNGHALRFFVGQQSEYEALTEAEKQDLFAIITNDTSKESMLASLENLRNDIDEWTENFRNGTFEVGNAKNATNATNADFLSMKSIATINDFGKDRSLSIDLADGIYLVALRNMSDSYTFILNVINSVNDNCMASIHNGSHEILLLYTPYDKMLTLYMITEDGISHTTSYYWGKVIKIGEIGA